MILMLMTLCPLSSLSSLSSAYPSLGASATGASDSTLCTFPRGDALPSVRGERSGVTGERDGERRGKGKAPAGAGATCVRFGRGESILAPPPPSADFSFSVIFSSATAIELRRL
jgi:hypothetical protein